jgi:hypothetical protein
MVLKMTKEWREEQGRRLSQLIAADLTNRRGWERDRIEARNVYYGDTTRPDIHWKGATDIHLPVLYDNVERLSPKMNNAVWGAEPHCIVDRVPEEYDPEETRLQEMFINWALDYDIENLFLTTHAWFRNMLLDGVGVVKTYWVTTWRNTCEVHRIKKAYQPGSMSATGLQVLQEREKTVADVLDELFGAEKWVPAGEPNSEGIPLTIEEDRRIIENVRVLFTDRSQFIDEIELLVYRPILIKDAPEVRIVEADDLIVPFRIRNLQESHRVSHKHWMTVDEIQLETRTDKFDPWVLDEGDVDRLKAAAAGSLDKQRDETDNQAFGRLRDRVEGTEPGASIDPENNQLIIYEVYLREDIDGDGRREDIVLQVSPDLNKVLHATYLDTIHPHGRRPFPTIHFLAPSDRFYVPGIGQFIAPLNIQANITINQVNDRQTLINNPIGFYRPMALPQDPDAMEGLKPGDMIPSPDPGGIVFPSWGTTPLSDLTIMNQILAFTDRIGTSPMLGGNQDSSAPRTARGTLALISEGNLKVDTLIDMAQKEGFTELMRQLFGLYSTFMPDEKYFYSTGHDKRFVPEMISRRLMRGNYQFKFRGNTVNTNPEVQRTLSQIRYQVASLDPLYLQDPVKRRELLRDFLSAHTEGGNVDRILPDLPGGGAEPHMPMSQQQENISMRLHRPVEVLDTDNHLDHIAEIDSETNGPDFDNWDPVAVALLAMHKNAHVQKLARANQVASLQPMGGSAPGGPGGGQRQMADMGLGNLEGGVGV